MTEQTADHGTASELTPIPANLVEGLNPEQRQAVETLDGPLVVVAGPGSGKTRVLTHRIAALVETGRARPWQVLAMTFTNKAAGEMRERIGHLVGQEAADRMWVSTFHSVCAKMLRINHVAAGLPAGFTILDDQDSQRVVKAVLNGFGRAFEQSELRQFASVISRVKNDGLAGEDIARLHGAEIGRVFAGYQRKLEEMGAVDFDDLLLRTVTMLESDTEVLSKYQERFRYVLVDEFQDTNLVQYRMVRLLSAEHRNLCVVGDADQSIYSWRGSTPQVMEMFLADHHGAAVVVLEENYRSTKAILEVCRSVIASNPATYRPTLETNNPQGEQVRLVIAADERDEAIFVVGEVDTDRSGGSTAVIMRTNAQTRPFEEELTRRGIPYQVLGALKFYDRLEVKDAIAYLRVLANPNDVIAFTRAAGVPRRGVGDTALTALADHTATFEGNVLAALCDGLDNDVFASRSRAGLTRLRECFDNLADLVAEGPVAVLQAVLADGLRDHHKADKMAATDRLANLDELVAAATNFMTNPPLRDPELGPWDGEQLLLGFLENVALVSSTDVDQGARVSLMTAHASKGKEFDRVFVAGAEDGMFPMRRDFGDGDLSEERRLFFVACSRARAKLTITAATSRFVNGRRVKNPPSSFLDDLPPTVKRMTTSASARNDPRRYGSYARSSWSPATSSPPVVTPRRPAAVNNGPRLTPDQAGEGARVRHRVFGDGTVEKLSGRIADIRFSAGVKKLDLDLAPLELLP